MFNASDAGERDDGVGLEIRRRLRRAVTCDIIRGSNHDVANGADAGRHRRAFCQRADAHCDVKPLFDQVDRSIEQAERHRHVGKSTEELGHDRQHLEAAEQYRRRQAQLATRRRAGAGRGPFDLLKIGEHATRPGEKPIAGLREADRARGAVEKTHSEPRFEVADDAADGGRRTSQPPCGGDETTPLGNLDEDRDGLGPVHSVANTAIISF
jgi:hypothetical protein